MLYLEKVGMAPYINAKPKQLICQRCFQTCDFYGDGVIVEEGTSQDIFENPRKDQTKEFLSRFRNT